jgi:hypothetical protein
MTTRPLASLLSLLFFLSPFSGWFLLSSWFFAEERRRGCVAPTTMRSVIRTTMEGDEGFSFLDLNKGSFYM